MKITLSPWLKLFQVVFGPLLVSTHHPQLYFHKLPWCVVHNWPTNPCCSTHPLTLLISAWKIDGISYVSAAIQIKKPGAKNKHSFQHQKQDNWRVFFHSGFKSAGVRYTFRKPFIKSAKVNEKSCRKSSIRSEPDRRVILGIFRLPLRLPPS